MADPVTETTEPAREFDLLLKTDEFNKFVECVDRGDRGAAIDALVAAVVGLATQSPLLAVVAGLASKRLRELATSATDRLLREYEGLKAEHRATKRREDLVHLVEVELQPWFIATIRTLADIRDGIERTEEVTRRTEAKVDEVIGQAALSRPSAHVYVSAFAKRFEADYDDAVGRLRIGDYESAQRVVEARLHELKSLIARAPQDDSARVQASRWRLLNAVILLNLQDMGGAREHLLCVEGELLDIGEQLQLAHLHAELGGLSDALKLLEGVRPAARVLDEPTRILVGDVEQLIQLCKGEVPAELNENADVRLKAAQVLLAQGRLARAASLAHGAADLGGQPVLYGAIAHLILMRVVTDAVLGRRDAEAVPVADLERSIQRVQGWLEKIDTEPPSLPSAFQEQLNAARYGYFEAVYDVDGRDRLEREGLVPPSDPRVKAALDQARGGDLEGALESLPQRPLDSEWVRALDAVRLALIAGDRQRFRDELKRLAQQHPTVGPINLALAMEYSREEQNDRALEHARLAHAIVPAPSYRAVLAHCLSTAGYPNDAWTLLAADLATNRPRILVQLAELAEKVHPDQAPTLWQRYAVLTGSWPASVNAAIALVRAQRPAAAAERAWQAYEQHATALEPSALFTCARLQTFAESKIDGVERIRKICRTLDQRFPDDPEAQQSRLLLCIELGDEADAPFDKYELLEQAGVLHRFNANERFGELAKVAHAGAERQALLWRFYESMAITLEGLAVAKGEALSRVLVRMLDNQQYIFGPVTLVTPPLAELTECEILLGQSELLLLAHLGLLVTLANAAKVQGTRVLIPREVHESIQTELIAPFAASSEASRVSRAVADFIVQGVQTGWLRVCDWPELHVGLQESLPSVPALRSIDVPETYVRTPLVVVTRFAGAVLASPKRWRVSLDFFGHSGVHHPWVIQSLAWSGLQHYKDTTRFLLQASARTLSVPQFIRLIWRSSSVTPFRRLEVSKELARYGFADALGSAEILGMVRGTSEPLALEWAPILAGLEHMALSPNLFGGYLAQELLVETYSTALVAAYLGVKSDAREPDSLEAPVTILSGESVSNAADVPDRLPATEARILTEMLLSRTETLSGISGTAIENLISRVLARTMRHLRQAVVPSVADVGSYEVSAASPAGQLWSDLREWTGKDHFRRNALARAMRDAWCVLDAISDGNGPTRGQQAPLFLAQRVTSELRDSSPEDSVQPPQLNSRESEAILSWRWKEKPLEHDGIWFALPDDGRRQVRWETILTAAAASLDNVNQARWLPFDERRLRFELPLTDDDLSELRGPVFVPVEAALLRTSRAGVQQAIPYLKFLQGRHDGQAYQLLEQLEVHPDDSALRSTYARYTLTALWRVVRDEPTYLLRWASRNPIVDGELRPSFENLCQVLHQSSDPVGTRTQEQWLNERLEHLVASLDKGGLTDRALLGELILQKTEIPGAGPSLALALLFHGLPGSAEKALERLDASEWHPAAALARDVMFLSLLTVRQPMLTLERGTVDLRQILPEKLDRLFSSIRSTSTDRGLMAEHETALLRACAGVAWTLLEDKGDRRQADWLWLTYRLHAWLNRQLASLDPAERRDGIARLAKAAPLSWAADDGRSTKFSDRFNPYLFQARGFDYRQVVLLFALDASVDLVRMEPTHGASIEAAPDAQMERLSNPLVERHLIEIARDASRRHSADSTWFNWPAPRRAPDIAMRALFKMNPERLLDLGEAALLDRIGNVPTTSVASSKSEWEIAEALVLVLSDAASGLSAQVREALERSLQRLGSAPEEVRLRWIGLTALFSSGASHLQEEVANSLELQLEAPDVELALSHYLAGVGVLDPSRLEAEVRRLLGVWKNSREQALMALSVALARLGAEGSEALRPEAVRIFIELTQEAEIKDDPKLQALGEQFGIPGARDDDGETSSGPT